MSSKKRLKMREVIRSIGTRSVVVLIIVFALTVVATCVGGYLFYQTTKGEIHLQGKMNVVESAKE